MGCGQNFLTVFLRILSCFIFSACLTAHTFAIEMPIESTDPSQVETYLVTIGYADSHNSLFDRIGIGSYTYFPEIPARITQDIEILFHELKLTEIEEPLQFLKGLKNEIYKEGHLEHIDKDRQVVRGFLSANRQKFVLLLNSNISCVTDAASKSANRSSVVRGYANMFNQGCPEQMDVSRRVAAFVKKQMLNFDHFVYAGHARYGQGLSFGDYNDKEAYVVPQHFTTGYHRSNLKSVLIASCRSEKYYRRFFEQIDYWYRAAHLKAPLMFQGFDFDPRWLVEVLEVTLSYLQSELAAD